MVFGDILFCKGEILLTKRSRFFEFALILIFISNAVSKLNPYGFHHVKRGHQKMTKELVFPEVVDEFGNFVSYEVSLPVENSRGKRSISRSKLFYKLNMNHWNYTVNLTINEELTPSNLRVEKWTNDGKHQIYRNVNNCHYRGVVKTKHTNGVAAMSNCHGINGFFSTGSKDYFIEPLDISTTNLREKKGQPHYVYEIPRETRRKTCGTLHPGKGVKFHRKKRPRRSLNEDYVIEVMVVSDTKMTLYHGQDKIEHYLLTLMNIVSQFYREESIGNSIGISVVRIIILNDQLTPLARSLNAKKMLANFCRWQKVIRKATQSQNGKKYSIPQHDNAILLTRHDICLNKNEPCDTLGLAHIAGMCEMERSCSITQDIGISSSLTITHELGHNLGMQHDGMGDGCSKRKRFNFLMSSKISHIRHPIKWSRCSSKYLLEFLASGQSTCLRNRPSNVKMYKYSSSLPGEEFSADEQCQLQFGDNSKQCPSVEVNNCKKLWCLTKNHLCITDNIPMMDATACLLKSGHKGWCYRGECITHGMRAKPIHGAWSSWSSWNRCSRSCGGGVETSSRQCSNPKPQNRGKYCTGTRYRYRSCNIQDCPKESKDFRAEQCNRHEMKPFRNKYYSWKPFSNYVTKPCALFCQAVGFDFYVRRSTRVVDGTLCSNDGRSICVRGRCKKVGCDRLIGSNASYDQCNVCNGNGQSCKLINGEMIDKMIHKIYSYQKIINIPVGSTRVLIEESQPSKNFLAIKDSMDKYYINGNWRISNPSRILVNGTEIIYARPTNKAESIWIKGPTKIPLKILILLQEQNFGVKYSFYIPKNETNQQYPLDFFKWENKGNKSCLEYCKGGYVKEQPRCIDERTNRSVSTTLCRNKHYKNICNRQVCQKFLSIWKVSRWGECSVKCGKGIRYRKVTCISRMNGTNVQDKKNCEMKKPITWKPCRRRACNRRKDCNKIACWITGTWSKCNVDCGTGIKRRLVKCLSIANRRQLPETHCSNVAKPAVESQCRVTRCDERIWVAGKWGQCSVKCGNGSQMRRVECKNREMIDVQDCPKNKRPKSTRRCWKKCENLRNDQSKTCNDVTRNSYCRLVTKFKYCKRDYFKKLCCKSCSSYL